MRQRKSRWLVRTPPLLCSEAWHDGAGRKRPKSQPRAIFITCCTHTLTHAVQRGIINWFRECCLFFSLTKIDEQQMQRGFFFFFSLQEKTLITDKLPENTVGFGWISISISVQWVENPLLKSVVRNAPAIFGCKSPTTMSTAKRIVCCERVENCCLIPCSCMQSKRGMQNYECLCKCCSAALL